MTTTQSTCTHCGGTGLRYFGRSTEEPPCEACNGTGHNPSGLEVSLHEHASAVASFLRDLYSTMIDPCAQGEMTVAEMMKALLSAAETHREQQAANPMHASAPQGCGCADCAIDREACPTCYAAWWKKRHPNVMQHTADKSDSLVAVICDQSPAPRDSHFGGTSYEASMLRNLLAVIHGDGGHYVAQHGLDKAAEDAEKLVANLRTAADAASPQATVLPAQEWLTTANRLTRTLGYAAHESGAVSAAGVFSQEYCDQKAKAQDDAFAALLAHLAARPQEQAKPNTEAAHQVATVGSTLPPALSEDTRDALPQKWNPEPPCWLVERRKDGRTVGYLGHAHGTFEWMATPALATRFVRREDANGVAECFEFEDVILAEHIWG